MKKGMKILLIIEALVALAAGLFGPIYAIFVESIGGDILTAGGAYSAYLFSAGILIFLISRWEDHVKHQENLIIIGYGLRFIGFIGYLFVQSPLHLFIVQAILGISLAIDAPAYDALFCKNLEKGKFASGWGFYDAESYIVGGVAAVLGAFIADLYGFRMLFGLMAILVFFAFLVSLQLRK